MKQQSILPCLKRMATDQHQEQPAEGQPAKKQAKFSSFSVRKKLAKPSQQQDDPPSLPPLLQQDDPVQFTFTQMTTDPSARVMAVWHTNPADMPVFYARSEATTVEYAQQWLLQTLFSSPSSVIIHRNAQFSFGVGGSQTSEGCNGRLNAHV